MNSQKNRLRQNAPRNYAMKKIGHSYYIPAENYIPHHGIFMIIGGGGYTLYDHQTGEEAAMRKTQKSFEMTKQKRYLTSCCRVRMRCFVLLEGERKSRREVCC